MKTCFSNAMLAWDEFEITRRESLIREIPVLLLSAWRTMNPAVKMERCETPIITPEQVLKSHLQAGFPLLTASDSKHHVVGYLRPETTAGTFEVMRLKFPLEPQVKKILPYCLWQVGCSFRDEERGETLRATKLRLMQFYQIELQLFAAVGTMSLYLEVALEALINRYGGSITVPDDLPHYSSKTLDWMIEGLEVAGCSVRTDWSHGMVFEVAIGLDRLVALQCKEMKH